MKERCRTAFTLMELLVVISIILILIAFLLPVLWNIQREVLVVKCQNNLRQMGIWLKHESMRASSPGYPAGSTDDTATPGRWPYAFQQMAASLRIPEADIKKGLTKCPVVKEGSVIDPSQKSFFSCSYAYVGNLNPSYACQCSWCKKEGGKIWKLFWSGVDYKGINTHKMADGTTDLSFSNFKGLKLADNLLWRWQSSDKGEGGTTTATANTQPTVPDHLDREIFHNDDISKSRTLRALRGIPQTVEDQGSMLPLMMDIVVYKTASLPNKSAAGSTWKATDLTITEANKANVLYANHCDSSATSKKGWGANVLYTNGMVKWKEWEELRFQVMAVTSDSPNAYHCYFY